MENNVMFHYSQLVHDINAFDGKTLAVFLQNSQTFHSTLVASRQEKTSGQALVK